MAFRAKIQTAGDKAISYEANHYITLEAYILAYNAILINFHADMA